MAGGIICPKGWCKFDRSSIIGVGFDKAAKYGEPFIAVVATAASELEGLLD